MTKHTARPTPSRSYWIGKLRRVALTHVAIRKDRHPQGHSCHPSSDHPQGQTEKIRVIYFKITILRRRAYCPPTIDTNYNCFFISVARLIEGGVSMVSKVRQVARSLMPTRLRTGGDISQRNLTQFGNPAGAAGGEYVKFLSLSRFKHKMCTLRSAGAREFGHCAGYRHGAPLERKRGIRKMVPSQKITFTF